VERALLRLKYPHGFNFGAGGQQDMAEIDRQLGIARFRGQIAARIKELIKGEVFFRGYPALVEFKSVGQDTAVNRGLEREKKN